MAYQAVGGTPDEMRNLFVLDLLVTDLLVPYFLADLR
jgi:hypothetical protein